jgi:hypothetical protein
MAGCPFGRNIAVSLKGGETFDWIISSRNLIRLLAEVL